MKLEIQAAVLTFLTILFSIVITLTIIYYPDFIQSILQLIGIIFVIVIIGIGTATIVLCLYAVILYWLECRLSGKEGKEDI